ncbi:M56 family metallopeptidase [Fusibacter ferrireducens]|uniref:M56 family metallopeptidase n=1 Tax=Fusibacter ferrireducens TaxID=2785058 RepID=A0ABR9ZYJ5_9FIRM|nr:M56 family metallopeptidase [Fusibacter ferrireducens]MBF4695528.1 M56 family metallopeptidase [Fusibacter ferrireducens]
MLSEAIYYILNMSILGVLVMGLVWFLRVVFKKWLPKNLILLLWGFVVIRLMIPFAIHSDFSIVTALANPFIETVEVKVSEMPVAPTFLFTNTVQLAENYEPLTFENSKLEIVFQRMGILWACGFIFFGILIGISMLKFRLGLNKTFYKTYQGMDVFKSSKLHSPVVIGVFRPEIVLPVNCSEAIENVVLLHEHTHIKRKDNLWKLLITLTTVVHWFNPLAWWMMITFSRDVELACDETVIKGLSRASKKEYAIALVEANEQLQSFITAFSGTGLETRIHAIVFYQRISKRMMVALSILYLLLAVGLLTSCGSADVSVENTDYHVMHSEIAYEKDGRALYTGFDSMPQGYTYEEALADGCIEAYEMSTEAILELVNTFHDKANQDEAYRVRFVMFMDDHKRDMFFQDLCYYEGQYYLFDSRADSIEAFGYHYIKIAQDKEAPEFGSLLLTDNLETRSEDVFKMLVSSVAPVGKGEFELVMFLPDESPVKLETYALADIEVQPVDQAVHDRIKKYMQVNGIHDVSKDQLECALIYKEDDRDIALVRVQLSYAWIDSIAVLEGDEVVAMLNGMSVQQFFITDLNRDGNDEILCHSNLGSGLLYHSLSLYDLQNHQSYAYTFYNDNEGIEFEAESDGVNIYSVMLNIGKRREEPLGKLVYDGKALYIDGAVKEVDFPVQP